jgi:SPP1 gp7 family putative phage head morphogenesis protein
MLLKLDEMKIKAKAAGLSLVKDQRLKDIEALKLAGKAVYQNNFAEELLNVFMEGHTSVINELGLTKTVNPAELKIAEIKAKQAALKQLNDLEFGIQNILLAGISTGATMETVGKQIDDYFMDFNSRLKVGVQMSVQETVDDGRREAADDPEVELAQWSAVIDPSLCDFCAYMDGKVVSVDDPLYAEYTPGNVHPNCRCIWIYILRSEVNKPKADLTKIPKEYEGYLRR